MAYISPIELTIKRISEELIEKQEGQVMQAIYQQGITVNKEELIKALAYDRDQYKKGWEDARKTIQRPKGEWDETAEWRFTHYIKHYICNNCFKYAPHNSKTDFCPNCGADMRPDEQEETE